MIREIGPFAKRIIIDISLEQGVYFPFSSPSLANPAVEKLKSESREITSRYIALSRRDTRERNAES